jgi:hypothetical protein
MNRWFSSVSSTNKTDNHDTAEILLKEELERYKRGNQNPYIKEEQTTQWPKEKVPMDKQRSTKHTYKTKN